MQPEQQDNYWQNTDESLALSTSAPAVEEQTSPGSRNMSEPVTWQASEYVHSDKSSVWIMAVLGASFVLVLVAIFLVQSWTFAALVVVMAAAIIFIGLRPPRVLNYALTATSIQIEEKMYNLHEFRSFGVVQEGAFYSVRLIPTKRFMPAVTLYFASELGEQIVDILGTALPMQKIEPDFMDKLLEKIHF